MTHTLMKSSLFCSTRSVALVAAMALACSASFAGKPDWAGGGNGGNGGNGDKHEQKSSHGHGGDDKHGEPGAHGKKSGHGSHSGGVKVGGYFGEQQRSVIHAYYGEQFKGHCPRGLAKKNNGCMPPGQAKKYALGQPLPRDVVYYPLPSAVSIQLGVPPSGYKYVRVASDILLIALGTSMVVDAIQDLGGL
jgi:Ni/Co efflux regulator RcnB